MLTCSPAFTRLVRATTSARFSSPVTVWDFVRYRSRLVMSREALGAAAPWMETLARGEGLFGHEASLRLRRTP